MPETELQLEGMAIDEGNILVKARAASAGEIIRRLGDLLYQNGYVKDSFTQAVLDREAIYPTGLQTQLLGFAIPHTDTVHVNRPAVAVATLEGTVDFQAMDNPEVPVPVSIVMMLAISDPKSVVNVLRKVISILENEPALRGLAAASSPGEVREIIFDHIKSLADKISTDGFEGPAH